MLEALEIVLFVDFCRFICGEEHTAIGWVFDKLGL